MLSEFPDDLIMPKTRMTGLSDGEDRHDLSLIRLVTIPTFDRWTNE